MARRSRRRFVRVSAVGLTVALAGCSFPGGGEDGEGGEEGGESGGEEGGEGGESGGEEDDDRVAPALGPDT